MERINQDIKTGQFSRLYLLYGDDDYFRAFAVNKLKSALISDDDFMNYAEYSGREIDVNSVIDTARTIPFLAERRVVLLKDTGLFNLRGRKADADDDSDAADADNEDAGSGMSSDDASAGVMGSSDGAKSASPKSGRKTEYGLAEFFAEIPDTTVIIISEEKANKGEKLYKAAEKNGAIINFSRIKENDPNGMKRLQGYILQKLKKDNMNITYGAMDLFLQRTGTDLRKVFLELDKLTAYTMGRESITEDDVRALIPERLEDRVFDMIEYITAFRQKEALDLYYDLLRKKESPIKIVSLIHRHYNQLYIVKELTNKGANSSDVAKSSGVNPHFLRKYVDASRRYSAEALRQAMEMCLEYDRAIKSGKLKDNIAVELIIVAMSSRQKVM